MTCIRAKRIALFAFPVQCYVAIYRPSCIFSSDLFKAPPLRPSSRNVATQHRRLRRCLCANKCVCMRVYTYSACTHTRTREISCNPATPVRVLKRGVDTCLRLSIAPQSLVSTSCYLFTDRRDIFRIDIRIYVTWELHKILFSSLECRWQPLLVSLAANVIGNS